MIEISFSTNRTLKHRASIAAVASLWNQHDIIEDIKKFIGKPDYKRWTSIENNVISSLCEILLPQELKLNLNNLVQPMGQQILTWIRLTQSVFQACSNLPTSLMFIWTERGTLDYIKTANFIIEFSTDEIFCYSLACIFCIEETILKFWPNVRDLLFDMLSNNLSAVDSVAVIFWTYHLKGQTNKLMSITGYSYWGVQNPFEFGFLFTLDSKCISSLNYFSKFIHPERKQRLVSQALQSVFRTTRPHDGNVVIFLLNLLTEYDVSRIIQEDCYKVLSSFLEWPCQDIFMPIVNSSWNNLSNFNYFNLLQDLAEFVSKYYMCDVYKILFKNFFRSSPHPFKEYVKAKSMSGTFLSRLCLHENTEEIIQMFFNECSPEEKKAMIFYFEGINTCLMLVKKERWNMLKFFVKNCISNKSILQEFVSEYKHFTRFVYKNDEVKLRETIMFKKFDEWIEDL